jgi:hypothetical protein
VLAGLLAEGIDVRGFVPTRLTQSDLAGAWRIVSFGPRLLSLLPPGASFEHWSDVPAVSDGFKAARNAMLPGLRRLIDEAKA